MHKVMPVFLDQHNAMHVCKSLKAELAYPRTLDEYKDWKSKFLYLGSAYHGFIIIFLISIIRPDL